MRILGVSDLHVDAPHRREKSLDICDKIAQETADVLVIGGDLSSTREGLEEGLARLGLFKGHKLFYAGNNELKALRQSQLPDYVPELAEVAQEYGFHLLDRAPSIIEGVGFVGGCGWYDGSLYDARDCQEFRRASERQQHSWFTPYYPVPERYTHPEFFEDTWKTLDKHLQEMISLTGRVCLGIHHVPSKDFLRGYKHPLDFGMGSERYKKFYQHHSVILGFTGHTHRSDQHILHDTPVHNLSTTKEKPYQLFHI